MNKNLLLYFFISNILIIVGIPLIYTIALIADINLYRIDELIIYFSLISLIFITISNLVVVIILRHYENIIIKILSFSLFFVVFGLLIFVFTLKLRI